MSITFILFGIILIFYLFGVLGGENKLYNLLSILASLFVLIGYFFGDVQTSHFTLNIPFLLALVLMLVLAFDVRVFRKFHAILFTTFLSALVLYFDTSNLLFYSGTLYFLTASFLLIIFLNDKKLFSSALTFYSLIYFVVDAIFCYAELGYVVLNFDFVLLVMLFLYALSSLFDYARLKCSYGFGGGYEKDRA